jgi:hypothetical protein
MRRSAGGDVRAALEERGRDAGRDSGMATSKGTWRDGEGRGRLADERGNGVLERRARRAHVDRLRLRAEKLRLGLHDLGLRRPRRRCSGSS